MNNIAKNSLLVVGFRGGFRVAPLAFAALTRLVGPVFANIVLQLPRQRSVPCRNIILRALLFYKL